MTTLPAELTSSTAPTGRKRAAERQTFLIVLLAALMVLATVLACSWAATRALMPDFIGESGRSRLNADYSPWDVGAPQIELDIPRLATAAARGEGNWNDANLPAEASAEPTEQVVIAGDDEDSPTPTATPTVTPTATSTLRPGETRAPTTAPTSGPTVPGGPTTVSTSAPTSPGSTSVPPTGVPPTSVPPTPVPPTPVPPTPVPPTPEPPTSVPTDPPTPVPPTPVPPTVCVPPSGIDECP